MLRQGAATLRFRVSLFTHSSLLEKEGLSFVHVSCLFRGGDNDLGPGVEECYFILTFSR